MQWDLMELGRTIYDRYKAGEEVEESTKALCDAIKDREASMGEYEKKIAKIKGASECPKCGKMVAKDMAYCPYCGEKVEKINAEPADEDAADEYAEAAAGETVEEAGRNCGRTDGGEGGIMKRRWYLLGSAGLCAGDQILKSLTEKSRMKRKNGNWRYRSCCAG